MSLQKMQVTACEIAVDLLSGSSGIPDGYTMTEADYRRCVEAGMTNAEIAEAEKVIRYMLELNSSDR